MVTSPVWSRRSIDGGVLVNPTSDVTLLRHHRTYAPSSEHGMTGLVAGTPWASHRPRSCNEGGMGAAWSAYPHHRGRPENHSERGRGAIIAVMLVAAAPQLVAQANT
jgi:hypothetical protein